MRKPASAGWSDYPTHFTSPDDVRTYDRLFESDACERICWSVQGHLLCARLRELRSGCASENSRALDFACGTGRITRVVRDSGWDVTGMDASAAMIDYASELLPALDFRQGLLGNTETGEWLASIGQFDLITAFRFFLNTPSEQRAPILKLLVELLGPNGHIVVNNHGSGPSLRNLGLRLRRKEGSTTLGQRDFVTMLTNAGLRVERQWGGQIFSRSLYALPRIGKVFSILERNTPRSRLGTILAARFGAQQTYDCRRMP